MNLPNMSEDEIRRKAKISIERSERVDKFIQETYKRTVNEVLDITEETMEAPRDQFEAMQFLNLYQGILQEICIRLLGSCHMLTDLIMTRGMGEGTAKILEDEFSRKDIGKP